MRIRAWSAILWIAAGPLCAETPLSAIDWLDDTPTVKAALPSTDAPKTDEPGTTLSATAPSVKVMPLGTAAPSVVGLIPSAVTGLPETLWHGKGQSTVARRIDQLPDVQLPALQSLLFAMMLTETSPIDDAKTDRAVLAARIKYLVSQGALDPALDLMGRAGAFETSGIADIWFDMSLLAGQSEAACPAVVAGRAKVKGSQSRIYCLSRMGKWDDAALLLHSGAALELIGPYDTQLLTHFLDPETAEEEPLEASPQHPDAMQFTLLSALGEPVPTASLPIVYANADLGDHAGWKPKILAAERLARSGAMPANRLLGIYTSREPAASGGVWDRVEALQRFETALRSKSDAAVAKTLPAAWSEMQDAGLGATFAQLFAGDLAKLPLEGKAADLAFEIAMVSPDYQTLAAKFTPSSKTHSFYAQFATGASPDASRMGPVETAIRDAFATDETSNVITRTADQGNAGTALLMAITRIHDGAKGDLESLTVGLASLRALGRDDDARRAALHVLILDRI